MAKASHRANWATTWAGQIAAALLVSMTALSCPASADEGGVSFWLPGSFGSLAAVPASPGWSFASVYYHTSVSSGSSVGFQRGGGIEANINADANIFLLNGNYVFQKPVLGGQAAIGLTSIVGESSTSASVLLTGPGGNQLGARRSDSVAGFGDLFPLASLRWNNGVHNFMVYTQEGVPVGAYDSTRLANLGIGHWAIDGGGGYTYFDPRHGHELSAVAGVTYNFINPSTEYQNGVDFHLDWGVSQFFTENIQAGLVGYYYNQLSADSGSGDQVGSFESRVMGVGPQAGFAFPVGSMQAYLNLKGYYEFDAQDRPDGWNLWATLSLSFGQ